MRRFATVCILAVLAVVPAAGDVRIVDRAAEVVPEPGLTTTRLTLEVSEVFGDPIRNDVVIPIEPRALLSDMIVTVDGIDLVGETVTEEIATAIARAEREAGRPYARARHATPGRAVVMFDSGGAPTATIDITTVRATTVDAGVVRYRLPRIGTDAEATWSVGWILRADYPLAFPDESDVIELGFDTEGSWNTLRTELEPDEIDAEGERVDLEHVLAPGAPARVEMITHRVDDGPGTYLLRAVFPALGSGDEPIRNVQVTFDDLPVRGADPSGLDTLAHGASFEQTGQYPEPGETGLTIRAIVDGEARSWTTSVVFPRYEDRWPEIERLHASRAGTPGPTILLPAERFEVYGIGTASRDRAAAEEDARLARRALPPSTIRADEIFPAFDGADASSTDIAAGAVDFTMLWLIAGGFVVLRLTRRWEARR